MMSLRIGSHLAVALLLSLAPASAFAQAVGKGGAAPSGPGAGGPATSAGALVLYGSNGNCPPTIACPPTEQKPADRKLHCTDWEITKTASGRTVRRCRMP